MQSPIALERRRTILPIVILHEHVLPALMGDDIIRMRLSGRLLETMIQKDPKLRNRVKAYVAVKQRMTPRQILALFIEQYAQENDHIDFFSEFLALDGEWMKLTRLEIRSNRDIVLSAVKQFGLALVYASSSLKNDRDVVLSAVQQNLHAMKYASLTLRIDRDFVLSAVRIHGYAMQCSSYTFKKR